MFRLSAKFLISLGLTIFLLGMLMLAVEIKIVPNATELKLAARARCCETVAMTCSMMAQKNDLQALQRSTLLYFRTGIGKCRDQQSGSC